VLAEIYDKSETITGELPAGKEGSTSGKPKVHGEQTLEPA
jgi:hypothetical protein